MTAVYLHGGVNTSTPKHSLPLELVEVVAVTYGVLVVEGDADTVAVVVAEGETDTVPVTVMEGDTDTVPVAVVEGDTDTVAVAVVEGEPMVTEVVPVPDCVDVAEDVTDGVGVCEGVPVPVAVAVTLLQAATVEIHKRVCTHHTQSICDLCR